MSDKSLSLAVAPELLSAIIAAARAEGKTPDEWIAEAAHDKLRRKDLHNRWQALTDRLQSHATEHGFKPEDVDMAIHDVRRGQ